MSHSGAAVFKKVSGILTVNEDASPAELLWRSTDGDKTHKVILNTIDKLQATPATSEKMMLRLIGKIDESKKRKDNEGNEVKPNLPSHVFSFNNRTVMDNIKETLQLIIARYKDEEVFEEKKRKESSMAPALSESAPLINTSTLDDSLSREKLLTNLKLQQSLLKENKNLMRTFQEAVINSGLPPDEFWSTRVPLLRAFALTTSQRTGPYNVLSTIKPVASSDNKVNVSVSREKILTIFQTYPIVKKAYDDSVPKNFKEQEFWARFFSSKLFRKLRGERIMQSDRGDMIIDRYLTLDQEFDRKDDGDLQHSVKKLLDLEGNDQDDPERKGNNPDFTMLPGVDPNGNTDGVVDILKGMNRLSQKMIKSLENEYSRTNLLAEDADKEEREELMFSDLEEADEAKYIEITVKQRKAVDKEALGQINGKTKLVVGKQDIDQQIDLVVDGLTKSVDLTKVTNDNKEINNSVNQIVIRAVKINAKQARNSNMSAVAGSTNSIATVASTVEVNSPLPPDLLESCRVLHGTCCEFLKHFYIHFQSGEVRQAPTVKKLYSYLRQCLDKITNLLNQVKNNENAQRDGLVNNCQAYLKSVLEPLNLAILKYEKAVDEVDASNAGKDASNLTG
ncbi:LANO_0G06568g1_1 [Lachancea nothofagi CBS 11611]|uniref:LANO_0G06568g1_1 n=1 Tax=Lachancea nothofagi CBS 11611 TaxID=1266666 RepID=A0A1G4KH74_9SACH|nr:LANO_0G06568g1_1 [Lachancea nothofagi CBS 11611]